MKVFQTIAPRQDGGRGDTRFADMICRRVGHTHGMHMRVSETECTHLTSVSGVDGQLHLLVCRLCWRRARFFDHPA